jgi:hypothetical protein
MNSTTGIPGVALDYAQQWRVLPLAGITEDGECSCRLGAACNRPGKHPLTKNGVNDATTNPDAITGWWDKWPQANVGVCTGPESGLVVVDVDPRNGGDKSLERLESFYAKLPKTLVCFTGGDGWHFYFQHPGLIPLRGQVPGYAGLDIKGDGGYVVAPPSLHHSGGVYQWLSDWRTTVIAPLPQWLLELIRAEEKSKGRNKSPEKRTSPAPAWADVGLGPEDWVILSRLEDGREGEPYQLLSEGHWRSAGYLTQSEADLALFNRLARLTQGDADRMYTIFKRTALMRDSKDKPFTYYQLTIQKAIDGMNWRPAQASTGGRGRR